MSLSLSFLFLLILIPLTAFAQASPDSSLNGWRATGGKWRGARNAIRAEGSLDNRLILQTEAPESFSWTVTLSLEEGRSAGALFWANEDGSHGYVAKLDSRLGELILARIGPWPEETRLAAFPWEPLDGPKATLRIEAGSETMRVFVPKRGSYPLVEARNVQPAGRHLGLQILDANATFQVTEARPADVKKSIAHVPQVGEFTHIYDPSVGEKENTWYINDHCFIHGKDGWHLFGITQTKPAKPMSEKDFAHASSPSLMQAPWRKQPYALHSEASLGENHLWAPHVIRRGETYYMFYCAGSLQSNYHFRIHLATSKDLKTWKRYSGNPLFQDFYDARDPMVLEDGGVYYLYYTANLDKEQNHHVVNVRTSKDLLHWSPARVALVHPELGTFGGPTESPFVVKYGDRFYLFCGPDGDYRRTVVYSSPNPYHWEYSRQVYAFPSHAAEVVHDTDGKWYASNCGWDIDGVYLAPLTWKEE